VGQQLMGALPHVVVALLRHMVVQDELHEPVQQGWCRSGG
jgi:hypothetical protein